MSLADSSKLDQGLIFETDKEISEHGLANSSAVLHPAGTVILSRDAGVGKSAILAGPMAVSQHFMAWQCEEHGELHNWFLYNWLQFHKKEFERQAVGSTIKTIGLPYFKKLRVSYPPIAEQRRIAEILSTWDRAIELTEELIATSQAQKKSLMQQLLKGKKRLPGFSGRWRKSTIEELFDIGTGQSKSSQIDDNGRYFIVDMGSIDRESRLCASKPIIDRNAPLREGDLVMPKDDIGGGQIIGRVAYIPNDEDFELGDHVYRLRRKKPEVDPKYFYYLINADHVRLSLRRKANGTAQLGLGIKDLRKQVVTFPPLHEQQQISQILDSAFEVMSALRLKLEKLKSERSALMQELLTGKRRVTLPSSQEEAA